MDKCFSKSVCNILKTAEQEMMNCHHPYVGTEHLLLSLLKTQKISSICYKYKLTYQKFKDELIKVMGMASKKSEVILYTPLLKLIIDKAYNRAYDDNKELDELYLFSALISEDDGIALRIMDNMNVDIDALVKEINKPHLIYELGVSLNDKVSDRVFLREKEINAIIEVLLRRNKNNPLLTGHSGVGKTAIVEELAKRISEGKVPSKLKDYEIVMINTSTLVAGTKYRGEFEARFNSLINEVKNAKNIILFIDEIHTLVKTGASDGSIDAANILKPYLARGEIKVIGATTTEEYNTYIKKDPALARRFTQIKINEPTDADMEEILNKVKGNYEKYYNLKISKKIVNKIIEVSSKYLPNAYNPDKCIELLDKTCSKKILSNFSNKKSNAEITDNDIMEALNVTNFNNINEDMYKSIFEQLKDNCNENLVKNIINLLKDEKCKNKYMYLNGDNPKEKRKLIKTISQKLGVNLIEINCLDYNDEYSISKFINSNYLYNLLEDQSNSFIIFNNYDSCNKVMYNLINSMLVNGFITNNINEKIYLSNAVMFIFNNQSLSNLGFNNNNLLFAH